MVESLKAHRPYAVDIPTILFDQEPDLGHGIGEGYLQLALIPDWPVHSHVDYALSHVSSLVVQDECRSLYTLALQSVLRP